MIHSQDMVAKNTCAFRAGARAPSQHARRRARRRPRQTVRVPDVLAAQSTAHAIDAHVDAECAVVLLLMVIKLHYGGRAVHAS